MHRDQWAFDFFSFPAGFEVECHTMWAMNDFTEENGATRVIPGSNTWDDKLRPDESTRRCRPRCRRARCCCTSDRCTTAAARTGPTAPRRGINVGYTLSWLRQEENQYLACPPEVARELPEPLARLAGYQTRRVRARLLRRPARSDRGAARRGRRRAELLPRLVTATAAEPLRLGLVGCGSIAQAHAAALRFLTDDGLVRVTAAADPDPAGVERVAQILGGVEHTG